MADRSPADKPVEGKTRQDRLAEALRKNLRRRKAQQKGRRAAEGTPSQDDTEQD